MDPLYSQAVEEVMSSNRASASFIQRKLSVGYNQAVRLIEAMEAAGIVSKPNHVGKREVLGRPDAPRPVEGASAKAIVAFLTDAPPEHGFYSYPVDAGDFGRCEVALQNNPEIAARFAEMARANRYWAALVQQWEAIRRADDRTAAIGAIIRPLEDGDPNVTRLALGDTAATMRVITDTMKEADRQRRKAPPVKETEEDKKVSDETYGIAAGELRQFIEQFEQLESEKKDVAERQKELMAEAKARGYDTKVMRKVIALRKRDKDDIAEEEAVLEMYKAAMGMA